jgi:hypothetical protein
MDLLIYRLAFMEKPAFLAVCFAGGRCWEYRTRQVIVAVKYNSGGFEKATTAKSNNPNTSTDPFARGLCKCRTTHRCLDWIQ